MGSCWHETVAAAPANNANQLNGYCYDAAGNLALNTGACPQPPGTSFTPIYAYDSENRLSSTAGYSYSYDADGVRVAKSSGSSGTMYWTGPAGEYLTETDLTGAINEEYIYFGGERIARIDRPSGTVHYYFSNNLGSASVITDSAGNVQQRDFYYPYGGIVSAAGSDPNHYKFAGKERDGESNLDEFGARYYSSNIGRFMTPDWAARPTAVPYAVFGDPQSLNLYTYVENGPVNRADADGHWQGPSFAGGTGALDDSGVCAEGGWCKEFNVWAAATILSNSSDTASTESAAQQNTQQAAQKESQTQTQAKPGDEHKGQPYSLDPQLKLPAGNGAEYHTYQVVDPNGTPVRDVAVQEHVKVLALENVNPSATPVPIPNAQGMVVDRVGPTAPPRTDIHSFLKTEQTFTATKDGKTYELSTKTNQYVINNHGTVTVQVVIVVP